MTMDDDRTEKEIDGAGVIKVQIKLEEGSTSDEEFLSCTSSPGNSEGKDPSMYFSQYTSESVEETFRGAYHSDTTQCLTDDERYGTPVPTTISQADAAILGLPGLLENPGAFFNLSPPSPSSSSSLTTPSNYCSTTTQLTTLNSNNLYSFSSCPEPTSFSSNGGLCFNSPSSPLSNELTYLSPNIVQEYSYDVLSKSNCDYEYSSLPILTSLGTLDNDNSHHHHHNGNCDFSLPSLDPEQPDDKLMLSCQIIKDSSCCSPKNEPIGMGDPSSCTDLNLTNDQLHDVFNSVKTETHFPAEAGEAVISTEDGSTGSENDSRNIHNNGQVNNNNNSFPQLNGLKIKDEVLTYSHMCTVCPARFATADDLDFHSQFHNNRGEFEGGNGEGRSEDAFFKCRKCDESFKSEKVFNVHLERHLNPNYVPRKPRKDKTAKEAVTCSICSLDCVCPSRLRDHMRKHTGEKPYQCDVCGKSFVTQPVLRRHAKEHEPCKPYECTICNKTFAARANLLGHVRLHDRKLKVLCPTCGKSYRNQTDLKIHERSHTGEKPYQCGICGKSFVTNVVLRRHERGHAEHKPFPCPICPKSFAALVDMRSHMRAHPIKDLPLQCYICSYECNDSTELGQHIDAHSLGKKKRFQCEQCGRTSRNQSEFDIHLRRHTGERPFSCTICQKSFVTNVILRKHLRSHATVKPYQCEICPKSFAAMADMKSHMRSHPAKKLQESILKFNLMLLGQYTGDMETSTTGVEEMVSDIKDDEEDDEKKQQKGKLSCSFCGKQSASASYIRAHERSHANGKIRYCSRCGKMCSSLKALMKHEKTVHKIDSFNGESSPPNEDTIGNSDDHGGESISSENLENENLTFTDQLPHGIKNSQSDHKSSISVNTSD